ncbi:hypothetical protein AB0K09_10510, partial [Streptomyces sp. NPDC049577]|uniref:hypothetical protein n=1 Tax=Streptomyces sp. NPDC049577 TaxID=3155153 RepID=UPI003441C62F
MTADPRFRAELFDCVQVNLALLADRLHGPGTGLRLGATLRFRPAPGPDGLPTVEPTVEHHLGEAARHLGLTVRTPLRTTSGVDVRPGEGCYVVADAYHLPWVPYFGQRHLEHSFLAAPGPGAGTVTVTDAYHNETPYGSARPGTWTLDAEEFEAAVRGPVLVAELAAGPLPAAPAPGTDLAGEAATDAYADAYARHPDRAAALHRLTLETWLLARSRALHAAYTDTVPGHWPEAAAFQERVRAWNSLTEQVYMAYRRVERGRAEPPGLADRLAEF